MVDLPTTAELFAFSVFFLPGYISLNIGSILLRGKLLVGIPWLEKVIFSYFWSSFIFLSTLAILNRPLTVDSVMTSFTTNSILLLGVLIIGFGFISGIAYYTGRVAIARSREAAPKLGRWLRLNRIVEVFSEMRFGSTVEDTLNLLWENRDRTDVVVETDSGQVFRGMLGSFSLEPTLDLLLVGEGSRPLQELVGTTWSLLEVWSILIPQVHIKSVRGIAR